MRDIQKMYSKALKQFKAKNYNKALKTLNEIKTFAPDYEDAYYMEANIWNERKNLAQEYYALKNLLPLLDYSSLERRNFVTEILAHIAEVSQKLNLFRESADFFYQLLKMGFKDNMKDIIDTIIYMANTLENFSVDDFQFLYDKYKECLSDIVSYPKKFYSHEKIRVGFLSADFKKHAVITWSWTLLTRLDKNLFKSYFYSSVKVSDKVTEYLQSMTENWRDIYNLTDKQAAELIRNDEIDILFDLSGHTLDNRLRVAAYRPAAVQISGIGYMNSTGLECFDYFLSDIYCAGNESYFNEKVIKLPRSHICYEPQAILELAVSPPCFKNNFVTFGSFNHFGKITDSILIAWKKILDSVPKSRLILKHKVFNTKDGKQFVGRRLKNLGLELSQVEMRPFSDKHLIEYGDVDIALDTFPYTGGVTTCEALYMGVPVISLYGSRHGTRFGLSILKNIGLDELAVDSYDEYINRAIMLAGDWELLTILRKNLRTMMKKSPLMDSISYIHEIEKVFIKIWEDERQKF